MGMYEEPVRIVLQGHSVLPFQVSAPTGQTLGILWIPVKREPARILTMRAGSYIEGKGDCESLLSAGRGAQGRRQKNIHKRRFCGMTACCYCPAADRSVVGRMVICSSAYATELSITTCA